MNCISTLLCKAMLIVILHIGIVKTGLYVPNDSESNEDTHENGIYTKVTINLPDSETKISDKLESVENLLINEVNKKNNDYSNENSNEGYSDSIVNLRDEAISELDSPNYVAMIVSDNAIKHNNKLKRNLFSIINQIFNEKSDEIESIPVLSTRQTGTVKQNLDDSIIKHILRSVPSPELIDDLENTNDVDEYINKLNSFIKLHYHHVPDPKAEKEQNEMVLQYQNCDHIKSARPLQNGPCKLVVRTHGINNKLQSNKNDRNVLLRSKNLRQVFGKENMRQGAKNKRVLAMGDGYANKPRIYASAKRKKYIKKKKAEAREARIRAEEIALVDKIMEFLESNILTTRYIFYELKRIEKTHEIRNNLRKMVWLLELPSNRQTNVAGKVLECYRMSLKNLESELTYWDKPTNTLVQQIVRDSENDG